MQPPATWQCPGDMHGNFQLKTLIRCKVGSHKDNGCDVGLNQISGISSIRSEFWLSVHHSPALRFSLRAAA